MTQRTGTPTAVLGYGIFDCQEVWAVGEPRFGDPARVGDLVVFLRYEGGGGPATIIAGRYVQDLPKAGGHPQVEVTILSFLEFAAAESAAREAGYRPPFEFWR